MHGQAIGRALSGGRKLRTTCDILRSLLVSAIPNGCSLRLGRFAPRTTPQRGARWSAAGRRRDRARCRSPTPARCSLMKCLSPLGASLNKRQPRSCFFFAANSSSVRIPAVWSSANFFNSSAGDVAERLGMAFARRSSMRSFAFSKSLFAPA